MCIVYFTICLQYKPYLSIICDYVQLAALLQLQLTYLAMFLFHLDTARPQSEEEQMRWGAILIAVNSLVFVLLIVLMWRGFLQERRAQKLLDQRRLLKHPSDERVIMPELPPGIKYHLFLSHVWKTGQDQCRIMKQRLLETLPDASIFLDIDDMVQGVGKEYLDISEYCLVFCTQGYFESKNCMRELLRAVVTHKKVITLLEPDINHGAMSREDVMLALQAADDGNYVRWGLDEELAEWAINDGTTEDIPDCHEIYRYLFQEDALEWERVAYFQEVTIRLLAERIANPVGTTYIPAELVHQVVAGGVPKLKDTKKYHVYVSRNNPGADKLIAEVCAQHGVKVRGITARWRGRKGDMPAKLQRSKSKITFHQHSMASSPNRFLRRSSKSGKSFSAEISSFWRERSSNLSEHSASEGDMEEPSEAGNSAQSAFLKALGLALQDPEDAPLLCTENASEVGECKAMLLYLTSETWTDPDGRSKDLADELAHAMQLDIPLILAHEQVSAVEAENERNACRFDDFFSNVDGQTPQELLKKGIYDTIAVPLKAAAWRDASLKMLILKLVNARPSKKKPKGRLASGATKAWQAARSGFYRRLRLFSFFAKYFTTQAGQKIRKSARSGGRRMSSVATSVAVNIEQFGAPSRFMPGRRAPINDQARDRRAESSDDDNDDDALSVDLEENILTLMARQKRILTDENKNSLSEKERSLVLERLGRARAAYYARSGAAAKLGHESVPRVHARAARAIDDGASDAGGSEASLALSHVPDARALDPALPSSLSDPGLIWAPSANVDSLREFFEDEGMLSPSRRRHKQLKERRIPALKKDKDAMSSDGGSHAGEEAESEVDDSSSVASFVPPQPVRAFQRAFLETQERDGAKKTIDRHLSTVGVVYTGITPNLKKNPRGVGSIREDVKLTRRIDAKTTLPLLPPPGSKLAGGAMSVEHEKRMKRSVNEVLRFAKNIGVESADLLRILREMDTQAQRLPPPPSDGWQGVLPWRPKRAHTGAAAVMARRQRLTLAPVTEDSEKAARSANILSLGAMRNRLGMRASSEVATAPPKASASYLSQSLPAPKRQSLPAPKRGSAALAAALAGVSPGATNPLCITDRRSQGGRPVAGQPLARGAADRPTAITQTIVDVEVEEIQHERSPQSSVFVVK